MLRGNDGLLSYAVRAFLERCGIWEARTVYESPWQDPCIQPMNDTLPRELRLLREYLEPYYYIASLIEAGRLSPAIQPSSSSSSLRRARAAPATASPLDPRPGLQPRPGPRGQNRCATTRFCAKVLRV